VLENELPPEKWTCRAKVARHVLVGLMLKVHRGLVTERAVEPPAVVVNLDGLKDGLASLVFVLEVGVKKELVFESAPE
jgi:hypothetical protein